MNRGTIVSSLAIAALIFSTFCRAGEREVKRAIGLHERIERAKQTVVRKRQGYVIVGQVVVEQRDDPALVNSQMLILSNGFFAGPVKDLQAPVAFRMHQYAPVDLELKANKDDVDLGAVINVGVVRMRRLPVRDLVSVRGQVKLEGSDNHAEASVSLSVAKGPVNTPSNTTHGRPRWPKPVALSVDSYGSITGSGFSPVRHHCSISALGYVSKHFDIELRPHVGADLGTIRLERPRRIVLKYVVSADGSFDVEPTRKTTLAGGSRWKADPEADRWDLEFTQKNGELLLDYSYSPCFIADLGRTNFGRSRTVNLASADQDPRGLALKEGHVYLLDQRFHKHAVLFKVLRIE